MRGAAIVIAALLLAGCGAKKRIVVFFTPVPVYPSATGAHDSANATFATRDWTLPKAGWRITDRNETGLRAHRDGRAVSIGVRGRTLEVISS